MSFTPSDKANEDAEMTKLAESSPLVGLPCSLRTRDPIEVTRNIEWLMTRPTSGPRRERYAACALLVMVRERDLLAEIERLSEAHLPPGPPTA